MKKLVAILLVALAISSCANDGHKTFGNGETLYTKDGRTVRIKQKNPQHSNSEWYITYPVLVKQENGDTLTEWRHYD